MLSPGFIFDTITATNKKHVSLRTHLVPRTPPKANGLCTLYLDVNGVGARQRIKLDIEVNIRFWSSKKQKLTSSRKEDELNNLLIANVHSKITKIRTFFHLSNRALTTKTFVDEFINELPRADFINFFKRYLEERKSTISNSTYLKEQSVQRKLAAFQSEILFCNIDLQFFTSYRNYMATVCKNNKQTRNGNIKIVKKYLRFAERAGVRLSFDLRDIKAGSTKGEKEYLYPEEVENLYHYYNSKFIPNETKIVLGYFLFSCFTGLRFGDTMALKRKVVLVGSFKLINQKTKKPQHINLNKKAVAITENCEYLFVTSFSNKHVNEVLKLIAKSVGITKNLHYHISRYTFATSYIRLGGDIFDLKELLNHSSVEQTKEYVKLVNSEKDRNADLLDNLF